MHLDLLLPFRRISVQFNFKIEKFIDDLFHFQNKDTGKNERSQYGKVRYRIENDQEYFYIDPVEGKIVLQKRLDYEKAKVMKV